MKLAERLLATEWWKLSPETIKDNFSLFNENITEESVSKIEELVGI